MGSLPIADGYGTTDSVAGLYAIRDSASNDYFRVDGSYRNAGGYGGIDSYTLYKSHLDMDIVQRGTNAPLFEGHAQARSQIDELDALVPNLIQAMFTGFPGRNGETVKITISNKRS